MVDAYSKYPCIHPTSSTASRATMDLLETDFAHFGYPHTIVSDNATTFMSEEFQAWCRERGIVHLTGAPYHPATNGAAERLVQSFKQALRKSSLSPKAALLEFLIQHRRTPLTSGLSPSELLNGRQIRAKLDTLVPSPAHIAQGKQAKEAAKGQSNEPIRTAAVYRFKVGDHCYALYFGPRRDRDPRWVAAIVTKLRGTRDFNVLADQLGAVTWSNYAHVSESNRIPTQEKRLEPRPTFHARHARITPRRSRQDRPQPRDYGVLTLASQRETSTDHTHPDAPTGSGTKVENGDCIEPRNNNLRREVS